MGARRPAYAIACLAWIAWGEGFRDATRFAPGMILRELLAGERLCTDGGAEFSALVDTRRSPVGSRQRPASRLLGFRQSKTPEHVALFRKGKTNEMDDRRSNGCGWIAGGYGGAGAGK
jgi:hypothetical protein